MRKNRRGESLLKNGTKDSTLTKHVIPGPDLHCAGPLALTEFLQHLPGKYKRRPKKVLPSEGRALALSHMKNTALVIALRL